MPCSHCKGVGHNFKKCPELTAEQICEITKANKMKKKAAEDRKKQRELKKKRPFTIRNNNDYEIVVYWGFNNSSNLKFLKYMEAFSASDIFIIPSDHRIVVFPILEVLDEGTTNARNRFNLPQEEQGMIKLFDMFMIDYPDNEVQLYQKYSPKKSELDEWKETALKSQFLLNQILKVTSEKKGSELIINEKFESISSMIDMIQDIKIPQTCTEADKEMAGIPSSLTNIT